jgi:hypothetical protein
MDNELGYGSTRFTIDWSPDNRTVALIATTNAEAAVIDRTLRRAATSQGARVMPAEEAALEDTPGSPSRLVGRIVFDAPQSVEDRLTLLNTLQAILAVELSGGGDYDPSDNSVPLCPHCHAPGTRDSNSAGLPIPGSPVFYFCGKRACTAPEKPHRWYKVRQQ